MRDFILGTHNGSSRRKLNSECPYFRDHVDSKWSIMLLIATEVKVYLNESRNADWLASECSGRSYEKSHPPRLKYIRIWNE